MHPTTPPIGGADVATHWSCSPRHDQKLPPVFAGGSEASFLFASEGGDPRLKRLFLLSQGLELPSRTLR